MLSVRAAWLLFWVLHFRRLSPRRPAVLLPTLAIALGTSLMLGILILNSSLTRSYVASNADLLGTARIEVTNLPTGDLRKLEDAISAVPGVAGIAPVIEQSALLEGSLGRVQVRVLGADRRLAYLASTVARSVRVEVVSPVGGLVLPESLPDVVGPLAGRSLVVESGARRGKVGIVGVLPDALAARLNAGRFVVMPLDLASMLFERGPTSILVAPVDATPSGVAGLVASLNQVLAGTAQARPLAERISELERSTAPMRSFSTFVSLVAVLVSAYLVHSSVSLSLVQRRREIALLVAIGESSQRLLARFVAEAAILGAVGSAAGTLAGVWLGGLLVRRVPSVLESAYGFSTTPVFPFWVFALTVVTGISAAIAGAYLPARGALAVSPVTAFRTQAAASFESPGASRRPLMVGIGLLAAGLALVLLRPKTLAAGVATGFLGVAFIVPTPLAAAIERMARLLAGYRSGLAPGRVQLAAAGLAQSRSRNGMTAGMASFALALVVAIGGIEDGITRSFERFASAFESFDLYATSTDDPYIAVPLPPALIPRIRGVPGVRDAYETYTTFVHWRGHRIWLFGESPKAVRNLPFLVSAGDPDVAAAALAGRGIVVSTQIARLANLRPGDALSLPSGCGTLRFEVAAVVETWGWPEGTMMLGSDWFERCFPQQGPGQLKLVLDAGASSGDVINRLRQLSADLVIRTGVEVASDIVRQSAAQLVPFDLVRHVAVLMIFLLVLNSRAISAIEARRQLGVLRAIGASRRDIIAAHLLEAGALVALVLPVGSGLGVALQLAGLRTVAAASGLPVHWAPPIASIAFGGTAVALAMLAGAAPPAWRAARVDIVTALRDE